MEQPTSQMSAQAGQQDVQQVIELLMKGATPEELLQMGIPEQVIMEAIQMLKQAQAQQEAQQQPQSGGMSAMATQSLNI